MCAIGFSICQLLFPSSWTHRTPEPAFRAHAVCLLTFTAEITKTQRGGWLPKWKMSSIQALDGKSQPPNPPPCRLPIYLSLRCSESPLVVPCQLIALLFLRGHSCLGVGKQTRSITNPELILHSLFVISKEGAGGTTKNQWETRKCQRGRDKIFKSEGFVPSHPSTRISEKMPPESSPSLLPSSPYC
jgi:hypothetical protein